MGRSAICLLIVAIVALHLCGVIECQYSRCGVNKYWDDCSVKRGCRISCDLVELDNCKDEPCVPGCQCQRDLYVLSDGSCVQRCPKKQSEESEVGDE